MDQLGYKYRTMSVLYTVFGKVIHATYHKNVARQLGPKCLTASDILALVPKCLAALVLNVRMTIIIIINDNVYGAVLMTIVTARVHPVHLMNAD